MSALYSSAAPASISWAEPYERVYQAQKPSGHGRLRGVVGKRRPDIDHATRLLIGSVVALGEDRPHGMITWLASVLGTSRETIYTIGEACACPPAAEQHGPTAAAGRMDREEKARAALTLIVEGAVALRPTRRCMERIIGEKPAIGWLYGLIGEAGERAGQVLADADWTGEGEIIVSRDELFMGETAWLLTVDAHSHAILSGHVEREVNAEVWAVSLALDSIRTGGRLAAVAEDAASWYPLSVTLAEELLGKAFHPTTLQDHWHLLRQADKTVRDAERIALRHMTAADRKARRHRCGWLIIRDFDGWAEALERADRALDHADAIRTGVQLLHEVLEPVDRRTGRLMDRATASWYLAEIVAHLRRTSNDLAAALAKTLDNQSDGLLAFHTRLVTHFTAWQEAARAHFANPDVAVLFERAVAGAWRLHRATTNGRTACRPAARRAAAYVAALCQHDRHADNLAAVLHDLLDGTVRTSAASENVNSILRAYLWSRRYFRDRRTAQNWLNLLVLWYNLRPFERGKRAGRSPYQLAGVTVKATDGQPTRDWLHALGYAAAA